MALCLIWPRDMNGAKMLYLPAGSREEVVLVDDCIGELVVWKDSLLYVGQDMLSAWCVVVDNLDGCTNCTSTENKIKAQLELLNLL